MENKLYVAYGSNLNLEQMRRRCSTSKVVGSSVLYGQSLLFRGEKGGAVATVEPKRGGQVPVLIWEIAPADEAALDRYEGFPFLYRKETVKIKLDGKLVEAMVYIMNVDDEVYGYKPLNQPDISYYSTIREGYKSAGFNLDVLRKATERSVEPD